MRMIRCLISGLYSVAALPIPVIAAQTHELPVPQWTVVSDAALSDMRGGMDLGSLVAGFAMDRVVEVDGTVVAQTHLVISNLDRLGNGGMPTISVSGPLAQVIQILSGGTVSVATPSAVGTSAPALAQDTTLPTPTAQPPQNNASIANAQTGSASVVNAPVAKTPASTPLLAKAPAANAQVLSPTTTNASVATAAAPNASAARALVASSPHSQPSNLQANAAPSAATGTPVTIAGTSSVPVTSGQVVTLSSLPSATTIGTAVQNRLDAATIQAKTTISATVNTLGSLNALTLADAIQKQTSMGH
jgi:hypothetical protein